jgi:DNA-directed RNA polymerase subunit RPC12/RpoP
MRCANCDENFRTIHLTKGARMVCYHCRHDNGVKETEQGQSDNKVSS